MINEFLELLRIIRIFCIWSGTLSSFLLFTIKTGLCLILLLSIRNSVQQDYGWIRFLSLLFFFDWTYLESIYHIFLFFVIVITYYWFSPLLPFLFLFTYEICCFNFLGIDSHLRFIWRRKQLDIEVCAWILMKLLLLGTSSCVCCGTVGSGGGKFKASCWRGSVEFDYFLSCSSSDQVWSGLSPEEKGTMSTCCRSWSSIRTRATTDWGYWFGMIDKATRSNKILIRLLKFLKFQSLIIGISLTLFSSLRLTFIRILTMIVNISRIKPWEITDCKFWRFFLNGQWWIIGVFLHYEFFVFLF